MFRMAFSALVAVLVICCPMICGSAPLLHHHGDTAPTGESPHSPHDSCTFDQCFCNGHSVPARGPAVDLSTSVAADWATPCDGAEQLVAGTGCLTASDRPPRPAVSDRSLPLLI